MSTPRAGRRDDQALVTVLLPVWNCERYIAETIDSVLAQTYSNFELLIINDASTDSTPAVIARYRDPRIRILENEENLGIASSLLLGVRESRGDFIARIDADDVCLKSRLARQVDYMQRYPEVGVLGGGAILFGNTLMRPKFVSRSDGDIKAEMLFRSPMVHPAVMFRKSLIPTWYDPDASSAEDYDLWVRLAAEGIVFANLALPVIRYRMHTQRMSVVSRDRQLSESRSARSFGLESLLGRTTSAEREAFDALGNPSRVGRDVFEAAAQLAVRMTGRTPRYPEGATRSLRRRVVRELAVLSACNPAQLRNLSDRGMNHRATLRRMAFSSPYSLASGIWYAISRRAIRAVRARASGTVDHGA